jgi:predicted nucleic acid-binding Zn ribbon protein
MPTYVYETIPQKAGETAQRFEIKQSVHDAPLTQHPETGQPVQRIIAGGIGILSSKSQQVREECCGGQGGPGCHCMCGDN